MRVRTILLVVAAAAAFAAALVIPDGAVGPEDARRAVSIDPPASIHLFYSPLGLIRAGTKATLSVDAVCATVQGAECPADVTLATQVPGEPWAMVTRPVRTGLQFDVTDIADRAAATTTGVVRFFLRRRAPPAWQLQLAALGRL